jgi:stage V sporulation protein G
VIQKYSAKQEGGEGVVVTDVRVRKILPEGKMKAIVSVTLDNMFVIHDVKVVEGNKGLFVAMPSRKTPDGEFRDIAHPINSSARAIIETAVLQAYEQAI